MSDNAKESTLKRCFEEIASPSIVKIQSPYRQPTKRRNLTFLLTDVPEQDDLSWLDANVFRRFNYPKRSERDAAVELATRKQERTRDQSDSTWAILKANVEYNIVQDVMERLFDSNSKGIKRKKHRY
jgi:hypothetical protein